MAKRINPAHFDVAITYDDEQGFPWHDCDGFPKVRISYRAQGDKAPGERRIGRGDSGAYYIVDYAEAVQRAKAEHWGCRAVLPEGASAGMRAVAAVDQTIGYMREWIEGSRFYSTVSVTDKRTGETRSLYQVEDGYTDEAHGYALEAAAELVRELRHEFAQGYLQARKERAARQYWEARDITTQGAHPAPYL